MGAVPILVSLKCTVQSSKNPLPLSIILGAQELEKCLAGGRLSAADVTDEIKASGKSGSPYRNCLKQPAFYLYLNRLF